METQRLVLPADLNQFGYLFGGRLLAWVDEASWIAASMDFPRCRFVTVAMDQVEFRRSVREGTILAISAKRLRLGHTSVTYAVEVRDVLHQPDALLFATKVTFVHVDLHGAKQQIPYE
jgi:uncharacterized protein (TIGR00369 family)